MGLETIVFEAAGAGAMTPLAPTTAIIRQGQGDAFIVAVAACGVTLERVTLTAPQDPRWDAAGFTVTCIGNGGVQDAIGFDHGILPKKVPIKRGITLTATQAGAGVGYCLVYVDYPDIGDPYAPRNRLADPQPAQLTFRTALAAAQLVANTITMNSVAGGITNFTEGRHYNLVEVQLITGGTGPEIAIGFTDPKTNLTTFFFVPITEVLGSGVTRQLIPQGTVKALARGDTLQVHYVSAATDTPSCNLVFAHDAGQ